MLGGIILVEKTRDQLKWISARNFFIRTLSVAWNPKTECFWASGEAGFRDLNPCQDWLFSLCSSLCIGLLFALTYMMEHSHPATTPMLYVLQCRHEERLSQFSWFRSKFPMKETHLLAGRWPVVTWQLLQQLPRLWRDQFLEKECWTHTEVITLDILAKILFLKPVLN